MGTDESVDERLPAPGDVADEVVPEEEDHEEIMDVAHHLPVESVLPPPILPKEKITKKQQAVLDKEKKVAERPSSTQPISKWFRPVPREPVPAIVPSPALDDNVPAVPARPFLA